MKKKISEIIRQISEKEKKKKKKKKIEKKKRIEKKGKKRLMQPLYRASHKLG